MGYSNQRVFRKWRIENYKQGFRCKNNIKSLSPKIFIN